MVDCPANTLSDTLDPILCRIEAEFNAKLIPRTVSGIYKIEFDRKALYKTDIATQTACMEKEIQYGVSTVNEWRVSREDMKKIKERASVCETRVDVRQLPITP